MGRVTLWTPVDLVNPSTPLSPQPQGEPGQGGVLSLSPGQALRLVVIKCPAPGHGANSGLECSRYYTG